VDLSAEFPEKLQFLFTPARYKVAYGGRGGSKSWGFARALILRAVEGPLRVLCVREFQSSIAESVHKLLEDQINALGLGGLFTIEKAVIKGPHGSEFFFEGIRANAQKIKSFEGIDVAWIEEAALVSKDSWNILYPTIRKAGSEIWVTFNPNLETDFIYQYFVKNPPADALVVKIGWEDNPWFPEVLRKTMEEDYERSPDDAMNIWGGECKVVLDGAVYAEEIRRIYREGRIRRVLWNPEATVQTAWDLGRSDSTAIWFWQYIAGEVRFIDFYVNRGKDLDHYIRVVQNKEYVYGTHYLPHDAREKRLGAAKSIEQQARKKLKSVRIVPKSGIAHGINASRQLLKRCLIDSANCAEGIRALKAYKYMLDAETQTYSKVPKHDWASNPADGFRYASLMLRDGDQAGELDAAVERLQQAPPPAPRGLAAIGGIFNPQSWMG
jgi:phage terminase large subunit